MGISFYLCRDMSCLSVFLLYSLSVHQVLCMFTSSIDTLLIAVCVELQPCMMCGSASNITVSSRSVPTFQVILLSFCCITNDPLCCLFKKLLIKNIKLKTPVTLSCAIL